jgi:hypothetical protein
MKPIPKRIAMVAMDEQNRRNQFLREFVEFV